MWFAALLCLLAGCDAVFLPDSPACDIDDTRYEILPNRSKDSRYRFSFTQGQEVSWSIAEQACVADGQHLASPNDVAERDAIYVRLQAHGAGDAWVGVGRDADSTDYFLITGEPAPQALWRMNQPALVNQFGRITSTGLETQSAGSTDDYICECDGTSPITFTF